MKKLIMLLCVLFLFGCAGKDKLLYQDHISYPLAMRGTVINWNMTKISIVNDKEYYENIPDFSVVELKKGEILYVKVNVQNFIGEIWEEFSSPNLKGELEVLRVERPINGHIRFLVNVPVGQSNYRLKIKRDDRVFDYFGNITINRKG